MSISDHQHFNCSQQHERDYVVRQYQESVFAKQEINKICIEKGSRVLTHGEIYKILDKKFTRK